MLNLFLPLFRILRASVRAFALKVSYGPISVECLFSMTLLLGQLSALVPGGGVGGSELRAALSAHAPAVRGGVPLPGAQGRGRARQMLLATSSNTR